MTGTAWQFANGSGTTPTVLKSGGSTQDMILCSAVNCSDAYSLVNHADNASWSIGTNTDPNNAGDVAIGYHSYASNAAAVAAGLPTNTIYRNTTLGGLDVVH
jgi:hypothetical protein